MTRRMLVLLVLVASLLIGQPLAAGASWYIWLYHPDTRQLVQVSHFGEAQSFALAVPLDADVEGLPVLFRDGGWIGYCARDEQGNTSIHIEQPDSTAPAYGMTSPLAYDLGAVTACRLGPAAFNAYGDPVLAVGITTTDEPTPPAWELRLFDLLHGDVTSLPPTDLEYTTANAMPGPVVPVVVWHADDLILRLEPVSSGGAAEYSAYRWNPQSGIVTSVEPFNQSSLDLMLSGEMVWAANSTPPAGEASPSPCCDTIWYDDGTDHSYPVYHASGDVRFTHPVFIDHGQQIALNVTDEETPDAAHWITIRRDGTTAALAVPDGVTRLIGAQQGYTFLSVEPTTGPTSLVYHRFDPNDGSLSETVLWQDDTDGWVLLWQTPMPYMPDLLPFPPAAE